jgi:phage host-nuclease inhibitor protein Gam
VLLLSVLEKIKIGGAAMAKKAIKKKSLQVPQDTHELWRFVGKIRVMMTAIDAIEAEANDEIADLANQINAVKDKALYEAKPLQERIEELADGVFTYAESHRKELTEKEKKKTVESINGDKIRWYFPPPSVVIKNLEAAIAELESKKLRGFIRIKKEVDKEEILKAPKKVKKLKNISVEQDEIFAIVPARMGIELQKGKKKFKKVALHE